MIDVSKIEEINNKWKIDTGSPHLICFMDNILEINVKHDGAAIRNSSAYIENGINVNFVELQTMNFLPELMKEVLKMRHYLVVQVP